MSIKSPTIKPSTGIVKGCKVWDDVGRRSRDDDDAPRPQFLKTAIDFAPLEEPSPVLGQINSNFGIPRSFWSMFGGESTLSLLLEATNDYIAEFWSSRKTPPSRKVSASLKV
jgi:hypothetical protein